MNLPNKYQICKKCVMDTTLIEVTFDKDGVCNFCRSFEESKKAALLPVEESKKRLRALIQKIKSDGRDKDYDCILGLSGGVDSSYLALILKDFGLRALAVQFDNGWNTELAVKNIENICEKLNIDLYTYVVNWDEFKDLTLSFIKASVRNIEAPTDHGIFAALYHVADQVGCKYIINGNNYATEATSLPMSFGHAYRDLRQIKGIHKIYGTIPLKTYPTLGFIKKPYYTKIKKIENIRMLDMLPNMYSKNEAVKILESKLNWKSYSGKHHESILTRFHQCYILIRKFKVDKRKAHLSNLIYSGQMNRDEALNELRKPPCPPELLKSDYEFIIKKLGISSAEFEQYMDLPEKSYSDYPNDDKIMKYLVKFYSVIRIPGLK